MSGSCVKRLCQVVVSGDYVGWLCETAVLGGCVVVSSVCVRWLSSIYSYTGATIMLCSPPVSCLLVGERCGPFNSPVVSFKNLLMLLDEAKYDAPLSS